MKTSFYSVRCGDQIIVERCAFSSSLSFRCKGLLGRSSLGANEAIWLKPCNSIHMFFMKFPIDAVFLDRDNRILKIYRSFSPWKMTPIIWKAHSVLELAAGKAQLLQPGAVLDFEEISL